MKLTCPNCMEENVFDEFKTFYTCKFCGQTNKFEDWTKKTQEKSVKKRKRGLELPAKISLTSTGNISMRVFIPQNYLRAIMGLPKLSREALPKREKKS